MDAWMTSPAWIPPDTQFSVLVFCEAVYPIRNAGTAVFGEGNNNANYR
jgi:hypothetical protein